MRLLLHLVLRIVLVVAVCLACTVGWLLVDTHRAIRAETAASADRVARGLERLYWRELVWRHGMHAKTLIPPPDWETLAILKLIAPGMCVTFAPGEREARTLCGQTEGVGAAAPDWFAAAFLGLFGLDEPVARPLTVRDHDAGRIVAAPDPATTVRQAWQQVRVVVGLATAMALAIAVLSALLIGHALIPARTIIRGLRRLELGDYGGSLPRFRTAEFSHIAAAVNDLARRLGHITAERLALTKRLLQVQEEERRALARDLHDEFGQCLTATAAHAAAIEAGAATDRPDLVEDARAIARNTGTMMTTVRGALARLRSQHIDEVGLEAALAQLVSGWNVRGGCGALFRLDVVGSLAAVPAPAAIDIYRIAQECLTNAARHGRPSEVRLHVSRGDGEDGAEGGALAMVVEDDGGGDASGIDKACGHGIVGIRERIAALGGTLAIGQAAKGLRIAASIPLAACRPTAAAWA